MNLPMQELLKSCKDPEGMRILIRQAEEVLRTWEPSWSTFISAPLREEAIILMASFSDFKWHSDGGHPGAERQRMQCLCCANDTPLIFKEAPINGLRVEGNFLFDKASVQDIRKALEALGSPQGGLGDIWLQGDRGAQGLCTPEVASALNGRFGVVRDVKIHCEAVEMTQLQLPVRRASRRFTTVEASTRIDAIGSAGFGLSRAKIVKEIKAGKIRLNWTTITQPSHEIFEGDRIQLENKGTIEVLNLSSTKRQRWRIELLRS